MSKIDYTNGREVFGRLAQLTHESRARMASIADLETAQRTADAELSVLERVAVVHLRGEDRGVTTSVYERHRGSIVYVVSHDGDAVTCVEVATWSEIDQPDPAAIEAAVRGDDRVRLSDGRTLDVTVSELAMSQAIEDMADDDLLAAANGFHLPSDAPAFVFDGNGEVS